jgi:hypothetical protein
MGVRTNLKVVSLVEMSLKYICWQYNTDAEDYLYPFHRCNEQSSVRQLQEQNSLLIRVCQELNQELAEVQEERASLELQLEQFRTQVAE